MIRRKAYSYRRRDGKLVHVPSKLIPGRRPHGTYKGKGIGRLQKGLLGRYGYSDVKNLTVAQRHAALRRAVKGLGLRHVERSLIAASTYSKHTHPRTSRIMRANERYIRR